MLQNQINQLTSKSRYNFDDLCKIMKILRSENGCPWDKEQTHTSIRNSFLEEAYEAVEGIDLGDVDILKEELGDVLLQVVFHSQISDDNGGFNIDDVCDGICKKMLLRHPHIFGENKADNSKKVLELWDEIKKQEKNQKTATDTLKGVSKALPSTVRAKKLQSKAAKVGFTYPDAKQATEKIKEEADELSRAIERLEQAEIAEELGDLLFAVVNVGRLCGIDSEQALHNANEKFIKRFEQMEELVSEDGEALCELTVKSLSEYWKKAKNMG